MSRIRGKQQTPLGRAKLAKTLIQFMKVRNHGVLDKESRNGTGEKRMEPRDVVAG
jgi:hypothetical protein